MTLVTGTVQDLGYDGMEGTLWARPARFRSDGQVVYAPERKPFTITDGVVSAELAPGPAVLEIQVGSHARGTFEVVIPEEDISLADLLDTVFPWEPEQVSLFVAEREAAQQAAADAETAAGTATTAAQQTGQDRTAVASDKDTVVAHVQALAEPNDAAVLGLISEGADTATKAALNATYGGAAKLINGVAPDANGEVVIPVGDPNAVTSVSVSRILASDDPATPLDEGDLLLVYEAPFSGLNDLASMDGFTQRFVPGTWAVADDATALDGKAIRLSGTSGRRGLSWDAPAEHGNFADVEVVARAKVSAVSGGFGGGVLVRGSGAAGSETGYVAVVLSDRIQLSRLVGGAYSSIAQAPLAYAPDQWYWIRLRAEGDRIKVKAWLDGASEPSTWQIDQATTHIPGPGWTGLIGSTDTIQTWDRLGVAMAGGTAPKGA